MNDIYEEALVQWENDVDMFFKWLELVCGVPKDSGTYTKLKKYITSVDEIKNWIYFFDGNLDNISLTTTKYLEWKKQKNIS